MEEWPEFTDDLDFFDAHDVVVAPDGKESVAVEPQAAALLESMRIMLPPLLC